MRKEINLDSVRERASGYYRNGDFLCAESVVKAVKEEFDLEFSDDVIAMASGFAAGMGGAGCTCGAVAGGVMALGMFFGRNTPGDHKVDKMLRLSRELHDNFQNKHRMLCCRALTAGKKGADRTNQCVAFTGEVAADAARIIARELHLEVTNEAAQKAASAV
jgi:C_GCAxxG_C_C family probable redox protein